MGLRHAVLHAIPSFLQWLLPHEYANLVSLRWRDLAQKMAYIFALFSVVGMVWVALSLITNCSAPLVVVLSGSMEPGYMRGDILVVHHLPQYPVVVGDIVIYQLPGRFIPIVHRVLRIHQLDPVADTHIINATSGKEDDVAADVAAADVIHRPRRLLLTKGDNNVEDDTFLFEAGRQWIDEEYIIGKTFGSVPILGHIAAMIGGVGKYTKYAVIGIVILFVALTED